MEFLSNFNFEEIKIILQRGWQDLVNTDFYQLNFSEADLALKVGIALFILILLKVAWILTGRWLGWENYSRKDSGHFISKSEAYLLARLILIIPTLALALPLLAILFAIANPYFSITKEEKIFIETRTRIDLRDVSSSMGFKFQNTGKANAEIAVTAHLKFLEMRRGKKDRTAFWVFSNDPYPVQEDFIIDDELYYLKVYDAPWEIGGADYDGTEKTWETYPVPYPRYLYVTGQGGTRLSQTLKVAIQIFDSDVKKQKSLPYQKLSAGRSILIITDADIADFSETKVDFEALSKRRIRPYIIFINGENDQLPTDESGGISPLLQEVLDRGGKIFTVSDKNAIDRAYQEIDKLEKEKVEVVKKSFKIPAFQKFIFLAIIVLIAVIPIGLFVQLLKYP